MRKLGDTKDNYIENVCEQLNPVERVCAIHYCRRDIVLGDKFYECVHSDDILCSRRCVELHWSNRPKRIPGENENE